MPVGRRRAGPGPGLDHRRRFRGHDHGRQRPRLAPPGDPRFQRRHRRRQHDRLRHPGPGRADDRAALAPARDHQPGPDRRLLAAGLRRHAADRAERRARRRRRPDDHWLKRHGRGVVDQRIRHRHEHDFRYVDHSVRALQPGAEGHVDTYRIDTSTDEVLITVVTPEGVTTALSLLDARARYWCGATAFRPLRR